MNASRLLVAARRRARLSQRALAARAGTSPAAVAMYESGAKTPGIDTLTRLLRAAGAVIEVSLASVPDDLAAREAKGRELLAALELAAQFPARRRARHLGPPAFPPSRVTP